MADNYTSRGIARAKIFESALLKRQCLIIKLGDLDLVCKFNCYITCDNIKNIQIEDCD